MVADSLYARFKGLMGKASLESGAGMLIEPCNSIHTFFMRFAIDVAYLACERTELGAKLYKVLNVRRAMQPWRMDFPVFGAGAVLELPAGGAAGMTVGDFLCLS